MAAFLVRRLSQAIVVLLLSFAVIYTLFSMAPNGPLHRLIEPNGLRGYPSLADKQRQQQLLSLDKPWYLWYPVWLAGDTWLDTIGQEEYVGTRRGIIRGDWGMSWKVQRSRPVLELIGDRLPATLWLMLASIMITLMIGVLLGAFSAVRQHSFFDDVVTMFNFIGISTPVFWVGMLLISVSLTAKKMGWFYFPTSDIVAIHDYKIPGLGMVEAGSLLDRVMHMVMPVMMLSLLNLASWSGFMRTSRLEVLSQDYVRMARAKGGGKRLVALRPTLVPLITLVVFAIPGVFTGAILTETVFKYKGLGSLFITALGSNDYPLAQAYLLLSSILLVLTALLADVLYTFVDLRIRRA